jgi:hypothetical protein
MLVFSGWYWISEAVRSHFSGIAAASALSEGPLKNQNLKSNAEVGERCQSKCSPMDWNRKTRMP